ncbi:MAG: hypothetical protein KDB23_03630, partial [Planctomycetales bacterium]|nr:hypothetical protein [Planctomycetales bacterium]
MSGYSGVSTASITAAADTNGLLDTAATATAIQTAVRTLSGLSAVTVAYDATANVYRFASLPSGQAAFQAFSQLDASASALQELTLSGATIDTSFKLKFGASGTDSASINVAKNGSTFDPVATGANIQTALRTLSGVSTLQVVYDSTRSLYRISGLANDTALLQLQTTGAPSGLTVSSAYTQELYLTAIPAEKLRLKFGSTGTETADITVAGTGNTIDGTSTAAAIQTQLRLLTGMSAVTVAFDATLGVYRVATLPSAQQTLELGTAAANEVSGSFSSSQTLAIAGSVDNPFRLQFGVAGLPTDDLSLTPLESDATKVDTAKVAADIQEALRKVAHNDEILVTYDTTALKYIVTNLSAYAEQLRVNTSGLTTNVTVSASITSHAKLTGAAGQQFRFKFGDAGLSTGVMTIGADNAATATSMQTVLRTTLGNNGISVSYDSTKSQFNITGLGTPGVLLQTPAADLTSGVVLAATAGTDEFRVFYAGVDTDWDKIVIEGSSGKDDYRVRTLQAIGLDGTSATSLRFEQLNGLLTDGGTPLSHVVIDVFGLDTTDYVRLDTLADNDNIDAKLVLDPVLSNLRLFGGAGNDRIVGSESGTIGDIIVGGPGNDRVTGGPGVDQFFESAETNDANIPGESDTLIETRDADFWLSDISLRIDDTVQHSQYGNEVESFADVFEAVELYGLDSANTFTISGWSDSGVIDGYKGGDTYILELSDPSDVQGQQFFNINDTGASGIDTLTFKGSTQADTIQLDTVYDPTKDEESKFTDARWTQFGDHGDGLLIGHFNATSSGYEKKDLDDEEAIMGVSASSLSAGANFQVVNYKTVELISLFGGEGNDTFISDGTSAPIDIFGNAGDDQFYIGSVLETEDVLVEGQIVTIVKQITDGALFNGTAYYGGDGDDYFEVNHNVADINLYGDNGDDTFLVKALLTINEEDELVDVESKQAKVSGTFGEDSNKGTDTTTDTREVDIDTLVYVENANVSIDGGAGFDAVSLVGTVLSDTFYIYAETDPVTGQRVQRIFGAGVKLQKLLNIERLQVLAGGGDDTIYLYGSDMGTLGDVVIKAGSGSDTVYVGGASQSIVLSFPKNFDQFFSTVEGYDVPKDATGKFIQAGEIDGMPFYKVRDVGRIVPFIVENPARTITRVMPSGNGLAGFLAPVIVDGGSGMNDRIFFDSSTGETDLTLSDVVLYKKSADFDDTKLSIASLATVPATDLPSLMLADTNHQDEAKALLMDAATNYIRFKDRYYDPTLLNSLAALTGAATQVVDVPAGIAFYNIQSTLTGNVIKTAYEELNEFATTFGLTVTWKDSAHPDPSRTETLHELVSISKNGTPLAFEASHNELVVFDDTGTLVVKNITGVSFKTTS